MRKVNEMVKRIRLATVNTCVLGHLRAQLPTFWGKEAAQDRLINNLPAVFEVCKHFLYGILSVDAILLRLRMAGGSQEVWSRRR